MAGKHMGERIRDLRMAQGMTQSDLAERMNVTDKAVSKWERNLSRPDIDSIPRLAEILGASVQELLDAPAKKRRGRADEILCIALPGIGLAMGICVVITAILGQADAKSSASMLGIGLSCLALYLLKSRQSGEK